MKPKKAPFILPPSAPHFFGTPKPVSAQAWKRMVKAFERIKVNAIRQDVIVVSV